MDDWKKPLSYEGQPKIRFERLRARLGEIGYAPERVARILGLPNPEGLYPLDYRCLPKWDSAMSESDSELFPAVRLLLLGLAEDFTHLVRSLGAEQLDFLLETGLAFRDGKIVHPRLSIIPFEQLLVATDRLFMNADPESMEEGLSSDNCVWRLDRTTLIMSRALRRAKAENVLELGCGSGVLSLLAAEDAGHVTGVDINHRSVNVAGFNARLNGAENVEFLHGDLYRPLVGKRFHYIFSNPPSAPGLVRAWNREGGVTGREMVEDMLKGLEGHLEPGGTFQTTMHFGYREKEDMEAWAKSILDPKRYITTNQLAGAEENADSYALREAYQKAGPRDYFTFIRTYLINKEGFNGFGIAKICFGVLDVKKRLDRLCP
jgi:SAM-dependent methyltransferase